MEEEKVHLASFQKERDDQQVSLLKYLKDLDMIKKSSEIQKNIHVYILMLGKQPDN